MPIQEFPGLPQKAFLERQVSDEPRKMCSVGQGEFADKPNIEFTEVPGLKKEFPDNLKVKLVKRLPNSTSR